MDKPFAVFAVSMLLLTVGVLLVMFCFPSDWRWRWAGVVGGAVAVVVSVVLLILVQTGSFGEPPAFPDGCCYVPNWP